MKTLPCFRSFLVLAACATVMACVAASHIASGAEPKRLLLLSQKPDGHPPATHEYAPGQQLLARLLAGVEGLKAEVAPADEPWEGGPALLAKADGVVLFASEGAKWVSADPRRLEAFSQLAARGGGLTVLHWGMGTREAAPIDNFLRLFGGCHGGPDRKYRVFDKIAVHLTAPKHPVLTGIADFELQEEFYFKLKFAAGEPAVQPMWQIEVDGKPETVAWSWERSDGGRSCGMSGLHFHSNWRREEYRRFVAQAALWSLKLPIPEKGLAVDLPAAAYDLPQQPTTK
jgi:hypothetical protein